MSDEEIYALGEVQETEEEMEEKAYEDMDRGMDMAKDDNYSNE